MSYIDGYLLRVPKDNLTAYKKLAEDAGAVWMKHGALRYTECVSDDMHPDPCLTVFFPELMKASDADVIIFSFIEFESREHRDQVNKQVMADPFMEKEPDFVPFAMEDMYFGGFKPLVDLRS